MPPPTVDDSKRQLRATNRWLVPALRATLRLRCGRPPVFLFLLEPSASGCAAGELRVPVTDDAGLIRELLRGEGGGCQTDDEALAFRERVFARLPEVRGVREEILAQDAEVAECLRKCGLTPAERGQHAWDLFVALNGLRPLLRLYSEEEARERWRRFAAEHAARPWSWAGLAQLVCRGPGRAFDWRANWHDGGDDMMRAADEGGGCATQEASRRSSSLARALAALEPWLGNLGMAFGGEEGATLCLVRRGYDEDLTRSVVVPCGDDLAAALDALGYPPHVASELPLRLLSSRRPPEEDDAVLALLCSSRYFCAGALRTGGGPKFGGAPALVRFVERREGPVGDDSATPGQLAQMRALMRGRVLERFPEARESWKIARRQAAVLNRVVGRTIGGFCSTHAESDDWSIFVFLEGLQPLASSEEATAREAWARFRDGRAAMRPGGRDERPTLSIVHHDWMAAEAPHSRRGS